MGNKGANLCEMKALELPMHFEFNLTTMNCIEYDRWGDKLPDGVLNKVMRNYRN